MFSSFIFKRYGCAYNKIRICCWACVQCPSENVKSYSGNGTCERCSRDYMSNQNRTKCMKINILTLAQYNVAYVIYVISVLGIIMTISIIVTFIVTRNTPVVRSTNLHTSMIQLLTLLSLFILPTSHLAQRKQYCYMYR